jgi:hypothetical protein
LFLLGSPPQGRGGDGVAFKVHGNCFLFLTTAMPFHAEAGICNI